VAMSPSDAWYQAVCRDGARIRIYMEITEGAGPTTFKTIGAGNMDSGSDLYDLGDIPAAIQRIDPIGGELNPLTRDMKNTGLIIDVDDAWLRPVIVNYRLAGQKVELWLGAAELDETDFVALFKNGVIDSIEPTDGHTIKLVALGQSQILELNKITGFWYNTHPLECLYDGAGGGVLEKGGAVSFNANSFDPTQLEYDDIEHLLVSRTTSMAAGAYANNLSMDDPKRWRDWGGVHEPTSAFDVAQSITKLLNGHLVNDEDGDAKFVRFDSAASAADDWTDDDFLPGSFKQDALDENIVNRIVVNFDGTGPDGNWKQSYRADETGSQAAYAYPGETERIHSYKFSTPWVSSVMRLAADVDNITDPVAFTLYGVTTHALSGNKAGLVINAGHPVYLLLDSTHVQDIGNAEIVKVTSLTRGTVDDVSAYFWDPDSGWTEESGWDGRVTIGAASRNQLGTSISAHVNTNTMVYDITPIVMLCDELLERFGYGAPIVEVATNLRKFPYQIGDLVSLTTDQFVTYGLDGITSAKKWEIIGKKVHLFDGTGRIEWKLAYAGINVLTRTGLTSPLAIDTTRGQAVQQDVVQGAILDGCDVTQTAGLGGSLAVGYASNGDAMAIIPEATTHTYTASKDTYVTLDLDTNGITYSAVNNAAAAPYQSSNQVLLAVVTTGAAAITSIDTDVAPTEPVQGAKLVESSVEATQLSFETDNSGNIVPNAMFIQWQAGSNYPP